jgi:hypothetical protein
MLTWTECRWHCEGRGIHAGDILELRGDNVWTRVQIESASNGRRLIASYVVDGRIFTRMIDTTYDHLRWPQ